MHMRGLAQMIGLRNSAGRPLNVGVIRALFWYEPVVTFLARRVVAHGRQAGSGWRGGLWKHSAL